MSIFSKIKKILFKEKVVVETPIDPEKIKDDKIINAQQQQIQALQAQIASYRANIQNEKEKEIKVDKKKKIFSELREREQEINEKRFGKTISLTKFFAKIFGIPPERYKAYFSKWAQQLQFMDKDGIEPFGYFGDLRITEDNQIAFYDIEDNPVILGRQINHIVHKPLSFGFKVSKGYIPIPRDKEGNYTPDLDDVEIDEPIFDEAGNIQGFRRHRAKKAINLLVEKEKELREEKKFSESMELAVSELQKENSELKRTIKIEKTNSEVGKSDLSLALTSVQEIQKNLARLNEDNLNLLNMKTYYESYCLKLESVNERLLDRIEDIAGKTKREVVREEVMGDAEYWKGVLPKEVPIKTDIPREEVKPVSPIPGGKMT